MGLYDTLRCHYPLLVPGANDLEYQTKSTPAQICDEYEIRTDGSLWHREYDQVDRSDPNARGLRRLIGMATRINHRWVPEAMTADIRFYTTALDGTWLEYLAEVVSGRMVALTGISPPTPRQPISPQVMGRRDASTIGEGENASDKVVHCVVEFNPELGKLVGRIVGFPHVEVTGDTFEEVDLRLRRTVGSMAASGSLVLESTFVTLINIAISAEPPKETASEPDH